MIKPFQRLDPTKRLVITFCVLSGLTTALIAGAFTRGYSEVYREGEIVQRSIVAPADITTIDNLETQLRRQAARAAQPVIFNYDSQRSANAAQTFRDWWASLKKQAEARSAAQSPPRWEGKGDADALTGVLIARHFDSELLDDLAETLSEAYAPRGFIYNEDDAEFLSDDVVLVDIRNARAQTMLMSPLTRMITVAAAQQNLRARLAQQKQLPAAQAKAFYSALQPLITATVTFDHGATDAAREISASAVEPVNLALKRGQVVAREGDIVTGRMMAQFEALRSYGSNSRRVSRFFGLLFIVVALYWIAWKYIERRVANFSLPISTKRGFALIGCAVLTQVALLRVGYILVDGIAARSISSPYNDSFAWSLAIPFAFAALLVAMLVDSQLAFVTGLLTALFAGLLAASTGGVPMAVYAMVSCAAAIYGFRRYRERQSVTLSGLIVGGANVATAVALMLYGNAALTWSKFFLSIGCALLGGMLAAFFTAGALPISETFFGILTDVKLLELSNADLPVLSQLALRAPGTNQHSHAVGQLTEDACRAIGANTLLARIGALYHDIGKIGAPDHFIENQAGGANPHDKLKPQQSARIITSHVTYGLKLAEEIGLPPQISDFIPQHHGTRTLHFFLRKAQSLAKDGETVDEKDFRYPGPKPQFKETAIMMIADSCEAAARTLARPEPENIRAIVSKIVDAIITDGQLDECNLTLREITAIRESIINSLVAIYHPRIDYPGFNAQTPLSNGNAPAAQKLTTATAAMPPARTPEKILSAPELDTEERGFGGYLTVAEAPIDEGGEIEDEAVAHSAAK